MLQLLQNMQRFISQTRVQYRRYRLKRKCQKILQKRRKQKARRRAMPEPRYDDVFYEGTKWLDTL